MRLTSPQTTRTIAQLRSLLTIVLRWREAMPRVRRSPVRLSAAVTGCLFATIVAADARSEEPKLSISGYDPVAYFTDGRPVQGKSDIEYLWHKLRWRFATPAHVICSPKIRIITLRNMTDIVQW